jgi:NTE family protein
VANNAAVSHAVALGADRIYVLPSGYTCALDRPPATALGNALQALSLLIEQRLILEVAHYADQVDLRVVPPLCPLRVPSIDFRHGRALIARARETSARWLDERGGRRPHPENFLSLHSHQRRTPAHQHGNHAT